MDQGVQLAGAALILAAFVGAQLGRLRTASLAYLAPNAVGAALLTADAWRLGQWGFVLLEGVWTAVSLWALLALWRGRPAGSRG